MYEKVQNFSKCTWDLGGKYIYIPQYPLMAKPTIKYSQLATDCHKGSHLSFFKMVHVKSL